MSEDKIKGITRKDFEEKLNKRYPNKDFKTALKENPKEAVTEIGLKGIPEDTVIKVVEDQKNVLYLVLPKDPMDNVTMSYICRAYKPNCVQTNYCIPVGPDGEMECCRGRVLTQFW